MSEPKTLRDLISQRQSREDAEWLSQAPDAHKYLSEPLQAGAGGLGSIEGETIIAPHPADEIGRIGGNDYSTVTVTADGDDDYVGDVVFPTHKNFGPWWEKLKPHRARIRKERHKPEFDALMKECEQIVDDSAESFVLKTRIASELRTFYARYLHDEQATLEMVLGELRPAVKT